MILRKQLQIQKKPNMLTQNQAPQTFTMFWQKSPGHALSVVSSKCSWKISPAVTQWLLSLSIVIREGTKKLWSFFASLQDYHMSFSEQRFHNYPYLIISVGLFQKQHTKKKKLNHTIRAFHSILLLCFQLSKEHAVKEHACRRTSSTSATEHMQY